MDPRLLRYYNEELQHLREMGAEFAQQFPKIAARLSMDGMEVADPYVERLLEGFAFLAARVQLRLDAEFPRFTQRLLEICYPNYLAPMPAMVVVQLRPNLQDTNLVKGVPIERGTVLNSNTGKGEETAARFRTAQSCTLWPLEVVQAQYLSYVADLPLHGLPPGRKAKAGIRLRLRTPGAIKFNQLALDTLRLHLSGSDDTAYRLYESIMGHSIGVLAQPPRDSSSQPTPWIRLLPSDCIGEVGFADDEALLPTGLRNFQGYRLLHEYFAFPQRFLFFDIKGLSTVVQQHSGQELDLIILLERAQPALEGVVDTGNFALHATPAINLFEQQCDRVHLSSGTADYHVVPDRTRPMDFEIFDLLEVRGYGVGAGSERQFRPMYAAFHTEHPDHDAYYCLQREPRLLSAKQKRSGPRSTYVGSEVFISLVDPKEAPYSSDLRQLSVKALCTNRDLPLHMPIGLGQTDFLLDISAPVEAVRVLKGPSKPCSTIREASQVWKFVNQLSLNHLSLMDSDPEQGAATLREMLELYALNADAGALKQIEGLRHVRTKPLVRRLPGAGRITFGRGVEVEVEVDEMAFQGVSAFLLSSVLAHFFERYVSINSFTETVVRATGRGEIKRWPPRWGSRQIL